jgi:hypothetical protein
MGLDQAAGGQLARGKGPDAFVSQQFDQLEAVVKAHSLL